MRMPIVAIVGRPNVGKSTLFNRIIKKRKAIVHDLSGLTRDRNYESTDWDGVSFDVVDTGGYLPHADQEMEKAIREQVDYSINEADFIVFVVDVLTGITDLDDQLGKILLKSGKHIIPVANKVDNAARETDAAEFNKLGFGEPLTVSAISGRRISDLLDNIVAEIGNRSGETNEDDTEELKITVVGKPNVGKSSFINALFRSKKMVVTDVPGTTRDSIDSLLRYRKTPFRIVDTAGLRKGKTGLEGIEYFSGIRALDSINRSSIVVMMIEAPSGIEGQDKRLIQYAIDRKKSMVIGFNKWDLVADDGDAIRSLEKDTEKKLRKFDFVPMVTLSALQGTRVLKVLDITMDLWSERNKRVPTHALNEVIRAAIKSVPPNRYMGRKVDIKYCTQIEKAPPVIVLIATEPKGISAQYLRYLEKAVRSHFGFTGTPITFKLRKR